VAAANNGALLTGVFWNVSGSSSIGGTLQSLSLGTGSVVVPSDGDAGKFVYSTNTGNGAPGKYGAFSSGYADWTSLVAGPNDSLLHDPPASPDGPDGGLAPSAGWIGGTGEAKVIIQDTAVWNVTGMSAGFSLDQITGVVFQYGTALGDAHYGGHMLPPPNPPSPVPLPAAAWAGLTLVGGISGSRALRSRRRAELI